MNNLIETNVYTELVRLYLTDFSSNNQESEVFVIPTHVRMVVRAEK